MFKILYPSSIRWLEMWADTCLVNQAFCGSGCDLHLGGPDRYKRDLSPVYFLSVLRIRDVYPGSCFYPSRIQKPQLKRGVKKKCCQTFFCRHNFHKIVNYFSFECWRKKFRPIFKKLKNFLPKRLSLSSQKYGFGIRYPEKTHPGSRGQKGTGSRIRIRNTASYERNVSKSTFPVFEEIHKKIKIQFLIQDQWKRKLRVHIWVEQLSVINLVRK